MRSHRFARQPFGIVVPLAIGLVAIRLDTSVLAGAPVISINANGAKIQIAAASLSDAIDAFSKAAGFKVTYEGARPAAMLFNTDIDTPSVSQSLSRLLEGQNLNYGVVYDLSGKKVTTLMIFGLAPKTGSASGAASGTARPQPFATPRTSKNEPPPVEDEPEEVAEPEPAPQPTPPAAPAPGRPGGPGSPNSPFPPSPFAPRSPFGTPLGTRPTPPPAPSPSP